MDTIGARVFAVRKTAKLSQIAFAKQIGISQTHVSKIEKGVEHPSQTLIKYISYRYNVNEEWLATGNGTMRPASNSAENDLIAVLKKYEENIPYQFKEGDVLAIAQILNILYCIITIDMPREKYNKPADEWFEYPSDYIDEVSHNLAMFFSVITKIHEFNTQKIDLEYFSRFLKNASENEAKHLIKIAHMLTTIPMDQLLQQ